MFLFCKDDVDIECKKNPNIDDNEKTCSKCMCYRTLTMVIYFTFNKLGQLPVFWVRGYWKFVDVLNRKLFTLLLPFFGCKDIDKYVLSNSVA